MTKWLIVLVAASIPLAIVQAAPRRGDPFCAKLYAAVARMTPQEKAYVQSRSGAELAEYARSQGQSEADIAHGLRCIGRR